MSLAKEIMEDSILRKKIQQLFEALQDLENYTDIGDLRKNGIISISDGRKKKRVMSPEARAKISKAQKRAWRLRRKAA